MSDFSEVAKLPFVAWVWVCFPLFFFNCDLLLKLTCTALLQSWYSYWAHQSVVLKKGNILYQSSSGRGSTRPWKALAWHSV